MHSTYYAIPGAKRESLTAAFTLGRWFASKFRQQAAQSGVQQAARNMRKQGVPLEMAVAVLAGRRA